MFDKIKITKGFLSDIQKQKQEYLLEVNRLEKMILQELEQILSESMNKNILKQDNLITSI